MTLGELLRSRFLRASGWMTVSSAAQILSGIAFLVFFGRAAGPAVLGLFTLARSSVEFVAILIDMRLDEALTRAVIAHREAGERGRALSAILVAYAVDLALGILALAVILLWAAPFAAAKYGEPALAELVRIYALGFFAATLNSSGVGVLQAFGRFREMGILFTLSACTEAAFPLVAWHLGWGIRGVMWAMAASFGLYSLGIAGLTLRLLRREFPGVRPEAPKEVARDLLRFGGVVTLSGALKTAFRSVDVLVLGRFATLAQIGFYQTAKAYGGAIGFFAGPFGSVLLPKLTEHAVAGRWDEVRRVTRRLTAAMAAVSLPIAAAAVLAAPWAIPLVMGRGYGPTVTAVLWMVLASALTNVSCYLRPTIVAVGRPGISVWTNLAVAACLCGAAWVLAPRTQHVGVAQAWFLAHAVGVGMGMWMLSRAMPDRHQG